MRGVSVRLWAHGRLNVGLRGRALVFAVVTIVVLTIFYVWESSVVRTGKVYPIPNFLGSTWYGPILLLLIPISLGWLSVGAKRRTAGVAGLLFTCFVLLVCLYLIYYGMSQVGSLPWGLPPIGGPVR